jgi:hypothetical protein
LRVLITEDQTASSVHTQARQDGLGIVETLGVFTTIQELGVAGPIRLVDHAPKILQVRLLAKLLCIEDGAPEARSMGYRDRENRLMVVMRCSVHFAYLVPRDGRIS